MKNSVDYFGKWWSEYGTLPQQERTKQFFSLPKSERKKITKSLFDNGWSDLFFQNYLDETLENIEKEFGISLIEMRLQALRFNKVFLLERHIWEAIEKSVMYYDKRCNLQLVFGGLDIRIWGKNKKFYRIAKK